MTILAVDVASRDVAAAEHLLHTLEQRLGHAADLASTHVVDAHLAVVLSWERPVPLVPADVADLLTAEGYDGALVLDDTSISTSTAGAASLVASAGLAAAEHAARSSGRLARFPGRSEVERVLTVGDLLAGSAVEEVSALAGTTLTDDTTLDLREWARPVWRDGRAVLVVQVARGGLVPFESRHQIACCSDH